MKLQPSLFALSLFVLMPTAGDTAAADASNAWRALWAEDYKRAEIEARADADAGDAQAQYVMAELYRQPNFTRCDADVSLAWYEKAAAQSHLSATISLGDIYHWGRGVPRSPQKAFEYYARAAELGGVKAQRRIGEAYATGVGAEKDDDLAFLWTKQAAVAGDVHAETDLAVFYLEGIGVERSYEDAFFWLMEAHDGPLYGEGPEVRYHLGMLYLEGNGVAKDEAKAFAFLNRSAFRSHISAMRALATLYEQGIGVGKDLERAAELRERADKIERSRAEKPDTSDPFSDPCSLDDDTLRFTFVIDERPKKPTTLEEFMQWRLWQEKYK